jgi:hypothetical protein
VAEHLSTLQIDMMKTEITPQYNQPPWTTIDHQQHVFELCSIVRGSNNQRFRAETNRILKENYKRHTKIYKDGSKKEEEVGYAVVWEEQTIKKKINENADTAAKEVLNERIQSLEKYPPQDLTKWIERKHQEEQ